VRRWHALLPLALQDRHYQDALRDLATGLLAPNDAKARRKILVASPSTAEGKTFLTLTLAQHLANAGRSVLVIECDLGAPKFETALGSTQHVSVLQGILNGDVTAARCSGPARRRRSSMRSRLDRSPPRQSS
jgi:succinoglycan biosynthesis transport protein ExoP